MMATTIMISNDLKAELIALKLFSSETYEDIIKDLIDDRKALSKETLKDIEEAKKDIKAGRYYTLDQLKKEYGIK
ncbi:MAG: hypothetical protein COT14_02820 [Candidatus Diapherotrites archaeon CG08_land_8_20_14_0_20_30_16]|nr:MAG: hypothetical protein COT14_02820 [Candidatus Diapherotrites archaeon CG08_land_8_20_14_0_20_30_16]